MSNPGRVSLELRGDAKDGEHVRLQEFVEKLSALQTALTSTERLITENKSSTFYKVVNLSHNSPATIELESTPKKIGEDQGLRVVESFLANLRHISDTGNPPSGIDYPTLVAYRDLCSISNKRIQGMKLFGSGFNLVLDQDLEKKIESAFGPDDAYHGEYSGRLEGINVHTKNVFTIYPINGGRGVECIFSDDMALEVSGNLKKRVLVYGKIFNKLWSPYPYRIQVEWMERLPEESEIPKLSELYGLAPGITGEKSPEEFLNDLREDDW